MRVRWNGRLYASWEELRGKADEGFIAFLDEWFDDKPYVIGHTSGSTGKPKEICLNKEDMKASARLTNDFLGICSGSVLFLCLSTSYIAGKMMVVRALEADAELITGEVASRPLKLLAGRGSGKAVDLAAMVPLQVEESLKHPEDIDILSAIRQILIGGAPVSPELEKRLSRLPGLYYATYGMTETVSHIALRRLGKEDSYFSLGKVSFSADERGCLVIHAPHLKTRDFVTNDVIELLDENHFKWRGRFDHVINSGGLKFFPEVIENKIICCFNRRYFISSLPDVRLGQRIVLVLEGQRYTVIEENLLMNRLRQLLTPYEMPKEILYISSFRETASGKVIRKLD